jgi:hypothetical protein
MAAGVVKKQNNPGENRGFLCFVASVFLMATVPKKGPDTFAPFAP